VAAVLIFRWPSCFSLGKISAAQGFSAVLRKLDFPAPGMRSGTVALLQCEGDRQGKVGCTERQGLCPAPVLG